MKVKYKNLIFLVRRHPDNLPSMRWEMRYEGAIVCFAETFTKALHKAYSIMRWKN